MNNNPIFKLIGQAQSSKLSKLDARFHASQKENTSEPSQELASLLARINTLVVALEKAQSVTKEGKQTDAKGWDIICHRGASGNALRYELVSGNDKYDVTPIRQGRK